MNKETFTHYQRELNSRRENELKSSPKLSPKVLLNDDDLLDVSLGNIPIEIKPPVLPVLPKPVQRPKNNQDSNPLW